MDIVLLIVMVTVFICSVPLDQEISKSHESVFREPATDMAMLTIGLKVSK